jgi:CrcB protein
MNAALLVFLGGGIGAVARWFLSETVQGIANRGSWQRFPLGILACNLLGCLAIGFMLGWLESRAHLTWAKPLFITGFLGGFTTFSAFGADTHRLLSTNLHHHALANILASTVGGILMVLLGLRLVGKG